jgi:hypothetical protein
MSRFVRFGLLVTGEGEREFLPSMFRSLCGKASCHFEVIRKLDQLKPRTSTKKHPLRMPGRGGVIPTKDAEKIGFPARSWLREHGEDAFVMLIDDLEWDRRDDHQQIFDRYKAAFGVLPEADRARAGVFFLVMMVEAYYFADPVALEAALGVTPPALEVGEDVEHKRHPKNELKRLHPGFRERADGAKIVAKLDLERVLENPSTCRSLRTLVAWCYQALALECGESFQLAAGVRCPVTGGQVGALAPGASS